VGRRLVLVGHGLRERLVLGPRGLDESSEIRSAWVRRYRCRRCDAITTVVPRGIARRHAYGVVAIVLALGKWAVEERSAREVRGEVSPFGIVGTTAATGWASLGRWARGAARLFPGLPALCEPTQRALAGHVLAFVASFAPRTTGALLLDALEGASHAAARWTSEV
jgi:hypothetical protein